MSRQKNSAGTTSTTFSPESADGLSHCASRDGRTTSPSGPGPARANLSARQANELGLLTTGTYGPPGTGSSSSAALQSSLESRLQARLVNHGSILYRMTWKPRATPAGRLLSRLVASARHISGKDYIGWPTPAARDWKGGYQNGRIRNGKLCTDTLDLTAQLTAWPTPGARDTRGDYQDPEKVVRRKERGHQTNLNDAAVLAAWPTPTVNDSRGGRNETSGRSNPDSKHHPGQTLCDITHGLKLIGSTAETANIVQLNPALSRWLMWYPTTWCDCAVTAMQSYPSKQRSS